MGYLVFDGNAFYEIDEECVHNKKVSEECEIKKYLEKEETKNVGRKEDNHNKKYD